MYACGFSRSDDSLRELCSRFETYFIQDQADQISYELQCLLISLSDQTREERLTILKAILKHIVSLVSLNEERISCVKMVTHSIQMGVCPAESRAEFARLLIAAFCHSCSAVSGDDAVSNYLLWTYLYMDTKFKECILQIFISLEVEDIVAVITELDFTSINWQNFIQIVAVATVAYSGAQSHLRSVIRQLLQTGLSSGSKPMLLSPILMARVMSAHNKQPATHYEEWWRSALPSSGCCTGKATRDLYNFLTEIVDKEMSRVFLKVHLCPPSWISTVESSTICKDYQILVKSRLDYLKTSVDCQDHLLIDDFSTLAMQAVSLYKSTRKVPNFILEMNMLKLQQYNQRFLPALMTHARSLQDSSGHDLIVALKRLGKFPDSIFKNYQANRPVITID